MIPITECGCAGRGCAVDAGADAVSDVASDAARTFACGPTLQCARGEQFCQVITGGAAGSAARYSCNALPRGCFPTPSCACLSSGGGARCTQSAQGDLTQQLLAP